MAVSIYKSVHLFSENPFEDGWKSKQLWASDAPRIRRNLKKGEHLLIIHRVMTGSALEACNFLVLTHTGEFGWVRNIDVLVWGDYE